MGGGYRDYVRDNYEEDPFPIRSARVRRHAAVASVFGLVLFLVCWLVSNGGAAKPHGSVVPQGESYSGTANASVVPLPYSAEEEAFAETMRPLIEEVSSILADYGDFASELGSLDNFKELKLSEDLLALLETDGFGLLQRIERVRFSVSAAEGCPGYMWTVEAKNALLAALNLRVPVPDQVPALKEIVSDPTVVSRSIDTFYQAMESDLQFASNGYEVSRSLVYEHVFLICRK